MTESSQVFKQVAQFCYDNLLNNNKVLSYLTEERKLSLESISRFKSPCIMSSMALF